MRAGLGQALLLAALLMTSGCMSMRTREFAADRAGATEAIRTAMRQEYVKSIAFNLRPEPAAAPVTAKADDQATSYVWAWQSTWRDEAAISEARVCLRRDSQCFAYEDVRAVRAVAYDSQSDPYPATPQGMRDALSDSRLADGNGRVAVEVRVPAASARREGAMYEVSVLEDGRICGLASEYPLPAIQRCYAYSEIAGGFRVSDTNSSFGEALADTALFPFRLVGAAVSSAGIGAH